MKDKLKVLHLFNSLMPSGAETMWTAAAPFLKEMGVETHVAATLPDLGPYAGRMEEAGFRVHHIPHKAKGHFDWGYFWRLYRFVRKGRFDAVQIHPESWRFADCLIAKAAGVPRLTATIHNVFTHSGWRRRLRGLLLRILQKSGVRIIACGASVKRNEERRFGYSPDLIWNGVDFSRYVPRPLARADLGLQPDQKVLVSVGNCSRIKNHGFILDVMRHLPAAWVWVHAGREEPGRPERNEAVRRGLESRVRFLGMRGDVPDLLRMADVMALPSLHEGFSLVGLESMAAGTPAVVAQVPGLVDIAELFDLCRACPLEAPAFARRIEEAAALPADALQAGRRQARELLKSTFDLCTNVAKYVALWRGEAAEG
ncbi:MAG TPA: hypothetical protein DER26_02120 [Verrucomicrobia bacterium]|nr:hypothetical protein [Verrucomicrobiota bacterium]